MSAFQMQAGGKKEGQWRSLSAVSILSKHPPQSPTLPLWSHLIALGLALVTLSCKRSETIAFQFGELLH